MYVASVRLYPPQYILKSTLIHFADSILFPWCPWSNFEMVNHLLSCLPERLDLGIRDFRFRRCVWDRTAVTRGDTRTGIWRGDILRGLIMKLKNWDWFCQFIVALYWEMAAILAKVFSLALRTMSKPLAHQMQAVAMQHPVFRQNAIGLAQVWEVRSDGVM